MAYEHMNFTYRKEKTFKLLFFVALLTPSLTDIQPKYSCWYRFWQDNLSMFLLICFQNSEGIMFLELMPLTIFNLLNKARVNFLINAHNILFLFVKSKWRKNDELMGSWEIVVHKLNNSFYFWRDGTTHTSG